MKSSTSYKIKELLKTLVRANLHETKPAFDKTINETLWGIQDAINEDEKYNGHVNFDTWRMSLNLDNEQALNEMVMTLANAPHLSDYDKAQALKEQVEEMFFKECCGVVKICDAFTNQDMINVNWLEIIKNHKDESYESEEDEDETELSKETLEAIKEINGAS